MKLLWQQIPSTTVSEILCHNEKFDGVVLDTEHGVFSDETIFNCIQLITSKGKKCLVRLTELNKTRIRYCLDAGADGLIFSTVEDIDYAKGIFDQCRYPKFNGKRGVGLVRENMWGEYEIEKKNPMIIAQIETKTGVENIEDISKIDFDYYMVGPYDMSASIGDAGNFNNPEFKELLHRLKQSVGEEKMGYHIVKDVEEQFKELSGCGFIAMSMDTLMLMENVKELEKIL
ncbi:hypothetical protein GF336_01935 [Candidatus Woesearchaeota archaeon]|nr:hypothetical protein [Candidatus Woesearchaeota archaeon]